MLVILAVGLGAPLAPSAGVRAQYTDGLPAGLREITVDGQPIDASTTPEVGTRNPEFAGRLARGGVALTLAVVDEAGQMVDIAVEVDAESGRFQGTAPDRLAVGRFSLYANDALVGAFVITGEEDGTPRARERGGPFLDLALIAPFPIELSSVAPDLGLVNARYLSVDEQARQTAEQAGDASREAVQAAADQLADAGWRQRYESVIAAPQSADPTLFDTQLTANVIEYADDATAEEAFGVAVGGSEALEAETIGDDSHLNAVSGVASRTGSAYRGLRLVFRQERVVVVLTYVDLLNRAVDQPTFEALGLAVQERTTSVLGEGFDGLSPKVLRLDLSAATAAPTVREAYEVVGGSVIRLYGEDEATLETRGAVYDGVDNAYGKVVAATLAGGGGRRAEREGTPAAADAGSPLAFSVALYAFADEAGADAWLAGLDARLQQSDLPGYLSFAAVADAPAFGDASLTYELNRQIEEVTGDGFRIYVRVGAEVAAVEVASAQGFSLEAVGELVTAQVDCLQRGACQDAAPLPGSGAGGGGGQ